jgi:L-2-hydroxyglutarate oxidase LhgO
MTRVSTVRCAVVGGGIIGLAVARQLTRVLASAEVTVFEKQDRVAAHQTGHNSGVVHAGLYYEPGSLKARLCRRGMSLLQQYCAEKGLPYEQCGKVVVARDASELARLEAIHQRAVANGVPEVRMLDREGLAGVEPHVRGEAALHSPRTAITDYVAIAHALADDVRAAGGCVLLGQEVTRLQQRRGSVLLTSTGGADVFDLVVACAGLQSDRVARRAGEGRTPRIVPFFGDYLLLRPHARHLVGGLVYPVPDPRYPFLGVHATRRVDGEVLLGPNAFLSLGREAYAGRPRSARDVAEVLTFPGFWSFAARNLTAAVRESRTVLSRRAFLAAARDYVPDLKLQDVMPGPRGIRAQAMSGSGHLVDDFVITGGGRVMHVRNAPSPGATSSLAIAEHVVDQALRRSGIGASTPTDPAGNP